MAWLPEEILWEIATKSPATFLTMATAIPSIGRHSLKPWVQDALKARFTVRREYMDRRFIGANRIEQWFAKTIITEYILPNGQRHSPNDKPAYHEKAIDNKYINVYIWYRNGLIHRDNDLPAKLDADSDGCVYRERWYQNGIEHRDNDKPADIFHHHIDFDSEYKKYMWIQRGKLFREGDKPIVIYNGIQIWGIHKASYTSGDFAYTKHRDGDLPAVIHPDGTTEYWRNGVLICG